MLQYIYEMRHWRAGGVTTLTRRLLLSISWLLYAVTITQ